MKFEMKSLAWLVMSACTSLTAQAAAPSAAEILKRTTQSIYSGSEESVYVMRLTEGDSSGEKLRKMRVLYKRGGPESAKLFIKFQEPADIRGTGLLSVIEKDKPADQWIYLPALKKIRRIKGGNESESFLGSDFTVGDLTSIDNDAKRYEYQVTKADEACESARCTVLTGTPKSGVDISSLPYSKKIIYVRNDNFVTDHIEFFNSDGKLEKTLKLSGLRKTESSGWLSDKMEMKNQLNGHATIIEVTNRDTSKSPADSAFTQSALERN